MKYKKIIAGLVGCIISATASASLVFDSSIKVTGLGFGSAPRSLTLMETGNGDGIESGCVGVSATGTITFGTCISDPNAMLFNGNGVTNQSGTTDLPNPLIDGLKYGIPTTGSLGITSANQIAILYNATETGGQSTNVTDLTLKFYTSTGSLLGAIDSALPQNFLTTIPGNGGAGFVFVVDSFQQTYVNSLLALGGSGTKLALEATIADVSGGPESFLLFNLANPGGPGTAIPEPAGIALFGIALLGGLVASRKRSVQNQKAS